MSAPMLRIEGVSKSFPGERSGAPLEVLRNVSFQVEAGEFVSIVGPSGCGKTTLLRILHGLESASAGEVFAAGRRVAGPEKTRAMVFQHFNLFPWLTVLRNVAFGMEVGGIPAAECLERARHFVHLVGLDAFSGHYPRQLSGGMQQRVGLARALALSPEILLMDEPFASLDALTREQLQTEVAAILANTSCTVILVTHNMDEAIFFSDRILVKSARAEDKLQEVRVDIPRPRDISDPETGPKFAALRRQLRSMLLRKADGAQWTRG